MVFSALVMEFYPDGNYQVQPELAERLEDATGTEVVWLPFSPDVVEQLSVDGLFKLDQWTKDELRHGRHIKEGIRRMFDEVVIAEQPALEKLAIVTQARNGEVLGRQLWVKAQSDASS